MIKIGGFIPFTTIDYPDLLSAVIFTNGCPLNCPYCHNPSLRDVNATTDISFDEVLKYLEKRKGILEGVVFSGGEPLLQKNISNAMALVKALGFKIGVHTCGIYPNRMRQIASMISWVGLDFKTVFEKYHLVGAPNDFRQKFEETLDILIQNKIPFEVRITTDPRVVNKDDVLKIATYCRDLGIKDLYLQEYRVDESEKKPPAPDLITEFYTNQNFLTQLGQIVNYHLRRK